MRILKKSNNNKIDLDNTKSYTFVLIGLLVVLFALSMFSITNGSSSVTVSEAFKYFTGQEVAVKTPVIMGAIRLPRLFGGLLVGCCLAVSGFVLQVILNNSLASPSTLGINSGAALFVVIGTSFFATVHTNVWAFFGSFLVVLLVVGVSVFVNASRITIILTGITIGAIASGLIDLITILDPDVIFSKTSFYIGGLGTVSMTSITNALPFIILGFLILFLIRKSFSVLILGDQVAHSLGVNVKQTRMLAIISVALLASSVTTIAGLIGFVGIIVPHIIRRIFCGDVKRQVFVTALFGSSFLLIADTIGKVIAQPYEIPVGVILSLLGGPFFIYLILSTNKRGRFL